MPSSYKGSIQVGKPYPLGSTYDGFGTNFALYSEAATGVTLCLIDDTGHETHIPITTNDGNTWHCYLPDIHPGQRYGYRIAGHWDPSQGQFYNPAKFLIDPYARAFDGNYSQSSALLPYKLDDPSLPSPEDSQPHSMTSVVVSNFFNWENDRPLRHPLTDTVIYEAHVRGLTQTHPHIPRNLRGTYAGLCHPTILEHLTQLGVTAIELLPVHQFFHDRRLYKLGLRNYWGYNTFGFFAPHLDYSSQKDPGGQVLEFKSMVKTFHKAGMEIILDVVYNHTAEGSIRGPMLSLRGIDNLCYYRTEDDTLDTYADVTGCGNTLNIRHPYTLQLVLDSLRYWVEEMHVDGFRFDLATTLLRDKDTVNAVSVWGNFLTAVHQDPILRQVKLIAEPWDLGYDGYQAGSYPFPWLEWNGKYRDTIREYWAGNASVLGEFAGRFTGSADLFSHNNRRPCHSINFVTAHDGFTLHDLVTYEQKNNTANGENNRDGESHNRNWNCGVEGPSSDRRITQLRAQQQRNMMMTLLLSQGTPMILHGDELCRTQHGNNNVYCQDNELAWIDWDRSLKDSTSQDFFKFTQHVLQLRRTHPIFRQNNFFTGKNVPSDIPSTALLQKSVINDSSLDNLPDVLWLSRDGHMMRTEDWNNSTDGTLAIFLNGHVNYTPDTLDGLHRDSSFLFLINPSTTDHFFELPPGIQAADDDRWHWCVDTSISSQQADDLLASRTIRDKILVKAHSIGLLERPVTE